MKAKNLSANSKAARANKLARAEREMTQAKLSAKQAKQDLKRARKNAKEARKRFKTARKAYKTLLKENGRGKIEAARKDSSVGARKRRAAREISVAAALMPQKARRGTRKIVTIPSQQANESQVLVTPADVPVDILPQNPAAPDVRSPGP